MIQRNQPALRDKTHNDPKEKEMLLVKEEEKVEAQNDDEGHVNSQVQLQDPVYECERF